MKAIKEKVDKLAMQSKMVGRGNPESWYCNPEWKVMWGWG